MPKSHKKPRDFDTVLGNDTSLTGGLVSGSIEGIRRRFSSTTSYQKASILVEALKYGDLGVDLLIEVMQQDPELIVRARAYSILQNLNFSQAQEAVKDGILFHRGDYFYQVYESVIVPFNGFDDIHDFVIENIEENEFYERPKLISNHLFKQSADNEANLLHQQKMLNINISKFDWLDFEYFDIYAWCQGNHIYHRIYSKAEYKEYYNSLKSLDYEHDYEQAEYYRLFELLQYRNDIYSMEQLWRLMGFNQLAFVHKRVVKEEINMHLKLSG